MVATAVPAQAWGAVAKTSLNCSVPRVVQMNMMAMRQAEITDAVDQERLLARVGGRGFLEPEADQQVRRQADAFPAHVQEQVVVRQHQRQHHQDEEVEEGEEAREAGIVVHVADGIDVNQEADAGDDQRHGDRKLVEQQRDVDLKLPATIHCHSTTSWLRSSAGRPSRVTNIHTATPKLSSTMPGASQEMTRLPSRVPNKRDDQRPQGGEQQASTRR